MPLFRAEATIFTIHERAAAKSINQFQVTEMMRAMRAFLKACIPRIPVRTGFLRGAFKPMRQFFMGGQAGADLNPGLQALFGHTRELTKQRFEHAQTHDSKGRPISEAGQAARRRQYEAELRQSLLRWRKGKQNRRVRDMRHQEWYYESRGRRVAKTQANAMKYVSPRDPEEVLQGKGLTAYLQFDVQISYYRINDYYRRITGSPWRSLDAGFQASLNYLEGAARRYPYLSEVLVAQKIFLRGSRVGKQIAGTGDNQAADYRRRFGGSFYPSSGDTIPEGSISQDPGLGGTEDNFGLGWMGNS